MAKIEIKGITHSYAEKVVLEDVSFQLKSNKIYGLIGENGSGKTTLISILAGIQQPQSGVFDQIHHPGLLLQGVGFYQNLSVHENLRLFALERGLPIAQINQVLALTSFSPDLYTTKYKALSQGYKQRLAIARSFLTDSNLILLDEPFAAVDLPTIRVLKKAIKQFVSTTHKSVLISSHQLKEVSDLLDEIIIIRDRKITTFSNTQHLTDSSQKIYVSFEDANEVASVLENNSELKVLRRIDDTFEIEINASYGTHQLLKWLEEQELQWMKIERQVPLEFIFY
ncbi:MAG: ABC transporter ATP-binding protein [Bacteroidota bacterium]